MKGPSFFKHTLSPFKLCFLSRIPLFHSCSLWENGPWILGSRKGLWTCMLRRSPVLDLIQALITSKFSPYNALFSGASTYSLATPFPVAPMHWARLWALLLRVHVVVWGSIASRNQKERRPSMSSCPSLSRLPTAPTTKTLECHQSLNPPKVSHSCKYAAAQMCKQLRCSHVICAIVCRRVRHHGFCNLVSKKKNSAEVGNVVMSHLCRCGCDSSSERPQTGSWDFFLSPINLWWGVC